MKEFYGRIVYDEFPIQYKCKRLSHYLKDYMQIVDEENYFNKMKNHKANEKAKIILRYYFDPSNKEFAKDYNKIQKDIGINTRNFFNYYCNAIMKTIGKIAECVVVDTCNNDNLTNQKCINIALYKENIYYRYPEINYSNYSAFSTSYKFYFDTSEDNILLAHKNFFYNPNDTTMDIAWCQKDNETASLMAEIKSINYIRAAHLQIKASTNLEHLSLNNYSASPIIVFDLMNDIDILRSRYPFHTIFSAKEISPKMQEELLFYYKQILAYVTGITSKLEITEEEYATNQKLQFIFSLPFDQLIESKTLGVNIENVKNLLGSQQIRIEVPC